MTVAKVVELVGCSPKSWEDAANEAVKKASETIRQISGVDVIGQTAVVKNNKVVEYRTNLKIAFRVE
ncbi:dodecin domain-containing protein [Candidatus Woesearchaeota archaeon]|nr:dodecin domain-containing protein [Candidatus Woesearchaeota archaeon]